MDFISKFNVYINDLLGGNQFAVGMVLAFVMGVITAGIRYVPKQIGTLFIKHMTTTMDVNSTTYSYQLIMKEFGKRGLNNKTRNIKLNNGLWGDDEETTKDIGYGTHLFFYNKHPLIITISKEEKVGNTSKPLVENMTIRKLGRSHKLFDQMVSSISKASIDSSKTSYYRQDTSYKEFICKQPNKCLDKVFLPKKTKDALLECVDSFVVKEQWYLENNIPYQLCILLYGVGGTGKTSLIKALATYLKRDINIVSSVSALSRACDVDNTSIIVVEEVDTLGMSNRGATESPMETVKENTNETKKLKFESNLDDDFGVYLLNQTLQALDGLISNHGRIVVMTTNHISKLDEALIRDGRVHLKLEVPCLDTETFTEMIENFYGKESMLTFKGLFIKQGVTGAKVQKYILLNKPVQEIVSECMEEIKCL